MSGFFALWRTGGSAVDPAHIALMAAAIARRGDSPTTVWHSGPIAVGHAARWLTPEAAGDRQLDQHSPAVIISADVRLDNRDALLPQLGVPPTTPDSALVLAAYRKWGAACPEHLIGDFAFVLWDADAGRLFAARDPIGTRPFFYHQGAGLFACASSIEGVLAVPDVPRTRDEGWIVDYLLMDAQAFHADRARTLYPAVRALPPGHSVSLREGQLTLSAYWRLEPRPTLRLRDDREYAAAFAEVFTQAVAARLRATGPVACALSGGLDSSSVTVTARALGGPELHTVYFLSPAPECDERAYVDAVLAGGGLIHHQVTAPGPLAGFDTGLIGHAEPPYTPNGNLAAATFEAAATAGARVYLDGMDGDTIVGYGRALLIELADAGHWERLRAEIIGYAAHTRASAHEMMRTIAAPALARALRQGHMASYARGLAALGRSPASAVELATWSARALAGRLRGPRRQGRMPGKQALGLIAPAVAERTGAAQRWAAMQNRPKPRTTREEHAGTLQRGMMPYYLAEADRMAADVGVEVRHPFCDVRVVELCLSLPGEQRLREGWFRYVLRTAMAGLLPDLIRWRDTKTDFNPHNLHSLLHHDSGLLAQAIKAVEGGAVPYLDGQAVQALYEGFLDQRQVAAINPLVQVAKFSLWWQGNHARHP